MMGQTLGHYRIVERIGAGGMGVVYRARDEPLGRDIALKVLPSGAIADDSARSALLREARLASALNHAHIATIYEVGEADGQAYIAMELVAGNPLRAVLPPRGLPIETLLRYAAQISAALAHAHERRIVHRDLKSANVIITPDGQAKVLDFGLAQRLPEEDLTEVTRSTGTLNETGALTGTLPYMAPEVLSGQPADTRSDIWALGVMLYEMGAGELPFKGKTSFELCSAILRELPTPLPPRVPATLRGIIQRCLAKEPGQRYQRASEVRAALEAIASGNAAAPAATLARLPRWAWILVGGAALSVFGVVASLKMNRIEPPPVPSGSPPRTAARLSTGAPVSSNVEANEYFEKAMLFLITQLNIARGRQMLERALELDPHFAEAHAWYGFTHLLLLETGQSNDAALLYKAEEDLRRALQDDPNSGRAHSALAAVHYYQGRKELVPDESRKALKANPNDLDAYTWLMAYHEFNGEYTEAEALAKQVMERAPLFFPARINYGEYRRQQGDLAGAVRAQEKILESDPQNLYGIFFLARAYVDGNELRKARLTLESGRPSDRQLYMFRVMSALLLALEGNRTAALKEADTEVLKYAAVVPIFTYYLAEFYAILGESEKALEWLERAVRHGDERDEWFRRDPLLANLREHPRFQQIIASIAYRRQQRAPRGP